MSSLKLVRIDVVGGVQSSQVGPFGDRVVRFTYNDFQKSYASYDAFPNEEIMIRDSASGKGFVAGLLAEARGKSGNDPVTIEAESLNNWKPLWVDGDLKAV